MADEQVFAGRHVVVTGGGRGIGAAIARRLAAGGARLSLMGRDRARLDATAADVARGCGADTAAFTCDVSDDDSVAAAVAAARQHFGGISILINNAGQAQPADFARMKRSLWDRMIAVNLTGAFLCTQQALPDMLAAGEGRVVMIASTAGLRGYKQVSAYCAAKHGVIGLVRALALETARRGVTVNAVCPGYTDTDLAAAAAAGIAQAMGKSLQEANAMLVAGIPQGRLMTPDEIAETVAFLCGPGAAGITGQAIAVAGGEVM
jgi:NAD(P)-dependent dehydrogenase (short-subunit alcohol dehydrogenase family)